ncbi:MAG: hypothetical protein P8181_17910, partial [bacterium]
ATNAGPAFGFLIFILVVSGCSAWYHIDTAVQDDGTRVVTMDNNEIKVEGARKYHAESLEGNYVVERRLFLNLRRITAPDGKASYEFMVEYSGKDWLKIEKGRSLELVVDGRSTLFSAVGEVGREMDPSGEWFTEWLDYPVDRDFLFRIATAQTIEVIVNGHEGEVRGFFDGDNFKAIRRFVAEYVETDGQGPPS